MDTHAACFMVRSCESAKESIEADRVSSPELESLNAAAAASFHVGISISRSLWSRSVGVLRTFDLL